MKEGDVQNKPCFSGGAYQPKTKYVQADMEDTNRFSNQCLHHRK